MNSLKIIRARNWWKPKLSSFLAIAYATALIVGKNLITVIPWFLFLLSSFIVGAAYVSLINDITDIKEDLASGKKNRMVNIPASLRWLFPGGTLLIGLCLIYSLFPDWLSVFFSSMSFIVFSLYSIPPVRLKNKGAWGVLADACGAHLFPCSLIITSTSHFMHQPVNWLWFGAVGIWSFTWGLRGILWHQFFDRQKDIAAGVNTYASSVLPQSFKTKAILILVTELSAFLCMLILIGQPLVFVFLFFYLLFLFLRFKQKGVRQIIIIAPETGYYQIFMNEYYQLLFPVSLLFTAALKQPSLWLLLIAQVLLFSETVFGVIKKVVRRAKLMYKN